MDALIIFSSGNEHPLNWMLDKRHRHVWCATKIESGQWVIYNWHQGNPIIEVVDGSVDLAAYYKSEGFKVYNVEVGDEPCHGPWMCNNCVGHTMVLLGIRTHFIFTPHQLWKHLTGRTMTDHIKRFFTNLCFVPGFGGGKTTFLPAPVSTVAPASQTTVDADAKISADEAARVKARKTAAGSTTSASSTLLDDDDSTSGALK